MKNTLSDQKFKIFWDIDGTLLNTNGAAAIPFALAVSDFAGKDLVIDRKQLSGFTDFEIARYLLSQVNIEPTMQDISKILDNYTDRLPSHLKKGKVEIINNMELTLERLDNRLGFEMAVGFRVVVTTEYTWDDCQFCFSKSKNMGYVFFTINRQKCIRNSTKFCHSKVNQQELSPIWQLGWNDISVTNS